MTSRLVTAYFCHSGEHSYEGYFDAVECCPPELQETTAYSCSFACRRGIHPTEAEAEACYQTYWAPCTCGHRKPFHLPRNGECASNGGTCPCAGYKDAREGVEEAAQ